MLLTTIEEEMKDGWGSRVPDNIDFPPTYIVRFNFHEDLEQYTKRIKNKKQIGHYLSVNRDQPLLLLLSDDITWYPADWEHITNSSTIHPHMAIMRLSGTAYLVAEQVPGGWNYTYDGTDRNYIVSFSKDFDRDAQNKIFYYAILDEGYRRSVKLVDFDLGRLV